MKPSILCVLFMLVFAACEGLTVADPGARSGDPPLGTLAKAGTCPTCPKQECPAPLITSAEFVDNNGTSVKVVLTGTTQEQADQLRLAFGMPTREEAKKAVRKYMSREMFDPKTPCKRVGVANVKACEDSECAIFNEEVLFDTLYVPVLEDKDGVVTSLAEDEDGRIYQTYFRSDDLVSDVDKAYRSDLYRSYYYELGGRDVLDDFVLVSGACRAEITADQAGAKKRRDVARGGEYPVLPEPASHEPE